MLGRTFGMASSFRACAFRTIAAVIALLALSTTAFSQGKGRDLDEIIVGQSGIFSGPAAAASLDFSLGAQVYFRHLNEAGGIGGRKVKLVLLDDKFDAAISVSNARQFLREHPQMIAFFGFAGTAAAMAMFPILEENKIVYFAPLTGATSLYAKRHPYVFHTRGSYLDEARAVVRQLSTNGQSSLAVVSVDDVLGRSMVADLTTAAREFNVKLISQETVPLQAAPELSAAAAKRMKATSPDAVFVGGTGSGLVEFIKQAKKLQVAPTYYGPSMLTADQVVRGLGAEEARGVILSQLTPRPESRTLVISREFRDVFAKMEPNAKTTHRTFEGYISAKVLAEGMRRAGRGLNRERLRESLETLKDYDVGGVTFNFSKDSHVGSTFIDLVIISRAGSLAN